MFSSDYCKIFKNIYFEEHLRTAASEVTLGSDCLGLFFLNSRFQNHPDLEMLQMYQPLSNQSFNHNLAHIPSSNLIPKLSFEP